MHEEKYVTINISC